MRVTYPQFLYQVVVGVKSCGPVGGELDCSIPVTRRVRPCRILSLETCNDQALTLGVNLSGGHTPERYSGSMACTRTALVVAATTNEHEYTRACLPDWALEPVTLDGVATLATLSSAPSIVLFRARGDERSASIAIRQLRANPLLKAVPILMVIGRYEIDLRSAIDGVCDTSFIIAPYTEGEVRAKIEELLLAPSD